MPELLIPWLTVFIGIAITWRDILATLYFRRQYRLIGNNWIIRSLYRTAATITAVVIILTINRIIVLIWAAPTSPLDKGDVIRIVSSLVSGLAIVWLAFIPELLRNYFEANEGRK